MAEIYFEQVSSEVHDVYNFLVLFLPYTVNINDANLGGPVRRYAVVLF